jgi:hypothetical protein
MIFGAKSVVITNSVISILKRDINAMMNAMQLLQERKALLIKMSQENGSG